MAAPVHIQLEVFSNGIFARPEKLRTRLADDRNVRSRRGFLVRKISTPQDWDTQDVEITFRGVAGQGSLPPIRPVLLSRFRCRITHNNERRPGTSERDATD